MLILAVALSLMLLLSCAASRRTAGEILIGLKPDAILLMDDTKDPDPLRTGISSLDSLNRKWKVNAMTPVFPDVSADDKVATRHGLAGVYRLSVSDGTNLATMVQDYSSDPHVAYAEFNQIYETE